MNDEQEQEEVFHAPTGSWNELAAQQRANRETQEMAQNQQMFDQFGAIEQNAKQQKRLSRQLKSLLKSRRMLWNP